MPNPILAGPVLPYFVTFTVSRVLSLALALAVGGYYAIPAYIALVLGLVIGQAVLMVRHYPDSYPTVRAYWKWLASAYGWHDPLLLGFRSILQHSK